MIVSMPLLLSDYALAGPNTQSLVRPSDLAVRGDPDQWRKDIPPSPSLAVSSSNANTGKQQSYTLIFVVWYFELVVGHNSPISDECQTQSA